MVSPLREREREKVSFSGTQCSGSGMFIPDPGSRISDPKTATKERGETKICCHTFICSHKFHKIEKILFLKC